MKHKRFVEVDVRFSTEGKLRPLQILFDAEHIYEIDAVKEVCRRASEVGGVGDRYTCLICGQEKYLWLEKGKWFVEAKNS